MGHTIYKTDGTVLFESTKDNITDALIEKYLLDQYLSGADLSGANLSRANLSRANLSGANLSGANLSRANLSGANLSGANLYGANLYGANLYGANLYGADLSGANLSRANLSRANLSGADLSGADLYGANLSRANLYGAENLNTDIFAKDLLYVFSFTTKELPGLRQLLMEGKINGSQYEGECCCLVGSLAKLEKIGVDAFCDTIPFYRKGTHNPGEQWFLMIQPGNNYENSEQVKFVVDLIDKYFPEAKNG